MLENKILSYKILALTKPYSTITMEAGTSPNEELPATEWIKKYGDSMVYSKIKMLTVLCRNGYMSNQTMRRFAIACANEACKMIYPVPQRLVDILNFAREFNTDGLINKRIPIQPYVYPPSIPEGTGLLLQSIGLCCDATLFESPVDAVIEAVYRLDVAIGFSDPKFVSKEIIDRLIDTELINKKLTSHETKK